MVKLTAGVLLAQSTTGPEAPVVQYGLVGLICWMVIRELLSLIRKLVDHRKSKGDCRDCRELTDLRLKVERLEGRVNAMGKK